jgi:hypothetical protein
MFEEVTKGEKREPTFSRLLPAFHLFGIYQRFI